MRATAAVQDLTEITGGVQLAFGMAMTVDGAAEPACVATPLLRPYVRTVHRRENR